jgi:hypothetical protein
MADWNKDLHKVIKEKKVKGPDGETLFIELFSYNKGPQKIAFRSEVNTKGGEVKRVALHTFTPEQGLKLAIGLKKFCKELLGIE